MNETDIDRLFRRTRLICGTVLLMLGLFASMSWFAGVPDLNRISLKFIPMAQDTAIAFIAFAGVLFAYSLTTRATPRIVGILLVGLATTYGLLKVIGYLLNSDLTLVEGWFTANEQLGSYPLNRMSPLTGGLFFLSGIGLLVLLQRRTVGAQRIAGWIGAIVFGLGSMLTYSYVLGEPFFYKGKLIPIAFLTAVGFCILGIGLIATAGPESILRPFIGNSTKSRILRLFVPLVVLTCFAQQSFHELSSATELNPTLVLIITPLAAALIAAVAGGRLAIYLSNHLNAANQLLEESEEKYRTTVEHTHDMYWSLDLEGRFVFANKKCAEVSGYEVSDWIGHGFASLLVPEDVSRVQEAFLKVVQGEVRRFEVAALRADGSKFYVEIASVPEYKFGKVVGVAGFGRDITERKQIEEALSKSEALLRESQSVAGIGSYELDISSNRWTSSDVLDEIMGIDKEFSRTVEGWVSLIHPEWRERMAQYFEVEVIGKRKRFDKEYKLVRKSDGKERWMHGLGALTFNDLGQPIRMIGTIQDITERKLAEAERENLESKLRQARKMETIGTLAGGVAHDFNNILTPILVYSDMAALELGEGHPLHSDLEHIIAGANRAKDLVKQILTFSRQMDNERISVKLSPVVKEAVKLIQISLPSNIKLETDFSTNDAEILGDPSQIHQVLMNLCTNAHHAMRKDGGVLKVSLELVKLAESDVEQLPPLHAGEFVRLTVTDNGCGMDEATRERIFEPFFTTKAVGDGTGLGLSVVHGIVKSHDGALCVRSAIGIGTTFEVYFPRLETIAKSRPEDPSSICGGNENVLLVDDDPDVAQVIKDAMERLLGYHVTVCSNSVEALELIRLEPTRFDLIMTDQKMPSLTGVQLAQHVMKIRKELPIILMTGFSDSVDEQVCKDLGISGFLLKPPDTSKLALIVREVLDNSTTEKSG